jgi:excisionase family DNA binding protein
MSATLELPTPKTQHEAQTALRELTSSPARAETVRVRVSPKGRGREHSAVVPRQAFELFLEVLGQLANGNAVTIIPVRAELTTQQAADLLNISRPHLVEMLERKEIPFRRVGSHRRIAAADVLAYKKREDARRRDVMDELTVEAQKLELGY